MCLTTLTICIVFLIPSIWEWATHKSPIGYIFSLPRELLQDQFQLSYFVLIGLIGLEDWDSLLIIHHLLCELSWMWNVIHLLFRLAVVRLFILVPWSWIYQSYLLISIICIVFLIPAIANVIDWDPSFGIPVAHTTPSNVHCLWWVVRFIDWGDQRPN